MRAQIKLLLVLVIGFVVTNTQAQQSDYQIKQGFEAGFENILKEIENSNSVNSIDSVLNDIEFFKAEFLVHEKMVDYAIYPESFDSKIATLKSNARAAEHKLLIIENQQERLAMLSDELVRYKSELTILTQKTEVLRKEIIASQQSEEKLSRLITSYRKSVEERDKFIFDMVDSLFVTYNNMSAKNIKELSGNESGTISSEENPLIVIEAILSQNLETLKAGSKTFSTEDYLRIYALQHKVNDVWYSIGDDLLEIYAGRNRASWKKRIETNLKDWKASASLSMWNSLDEYLELKEMDLGAFDNNSSFFKALDTFVTDAATNSQEEIISSSSYEDFKVFSEFWTSKVLDDWNNYLVEADVLTSSQIAMIDNKVDEWEGSSRPMSIGLVFAIGFAVLLLIGLIIALIMK